MNEIQTFTSETYGQVRVFLQDGEPWLVAKDVCQALGIADPNQSCRGLDEDEKGLFAIQTPAGFRRLSTSPSRASTSS